MTLEFGTNADGQPGETVQREPSFFGYRVSVVSNTLDWNHIGRLRRWSSTQRRRKEPRRYSLAHRVGNLHLWFDHANPRDQGHVIRA